MEWVVASAIGGTALALSVFQEFRHWREGLAKLEVDMRTVWRRRNSQDLTDLVVAEILTFNPSMKGIAISHIRLEVRNRSEIGFDLARPKRVGSEWELEPLGSRTQLRVSGDFDLPYTIPPITLAARQGDSAVIAFFPNAPVANLNPADLRVFVRLGSRRANTQGLLRWRKLFGRELPPFEEVEARWLDAGIAYTGTTISAG